MPWNDYLNGGGLFGGYGGFGDLSEEARRRANNQGLMTAGALMMRNSVGPNNMGFMGNMSSALLAGRESFESILDREAVREAMLERKRKQEELEAERIKMQEEAEERVFQDWQTKEARNTQMVDTISQATGKPFEAVDVLSDAKKADLYALHSGIIQPEVEEDSLWSEGGRKYRGIPNKREEFIGFEPRLPKEPKDPLTPEELEEKEYQARRRWVENYARELGMRDKVEKTVPNSKGEMETVLRPRFETYEDRILEAESAWEREQMKRRGGGSRLFDSSGEGGTRKVIPLDVLSQIEREVSVLPQEEREAAKKFLYQKYLSSLR